MLFKKLVIKVNIVESGMLGSIILICKTVNSETVQLCGRTSLTKWGSWIRKIILKISIAYIISKGDLGSETEHSVNQNRNRKKTTVNSTR